MIMGSVVQGPWAGSGLAGLEQGTDFNCTSTSCAGITQSGESAPGAVAQTFVNLQRAINRWSGKAGFQSIGVDGLIGAATVGALQKAGNVMLSILPGALATVAQNMFAQNLTKENVAANAQQLTDSLNSGADKLEAQGALPPPNTSGGGGGGGSAASSSSTPDASLISPQDSSQGSNGNLLWWLLGGFAVVATAGIATVVVIRRRKKGAPKRPMPKGSRAHAYHAY